MTDVPWGKDAPARSVYTPLFPVVAGFAERSGQPIRFLPFMLAAFPLMLLSILVANIYIYLRYL